MHASEGLRGIVQAGLALTSSTGFRSLNEVSEIPPAYPMPTIVMEIYASVTIPIKRYHSSKCPNFQKGLSTCTDLTIFVGGRNSRDHANRIPWCQNNAGLQADGNHKTIHGRTYVKQLRRSAPSSHGHVPERSRLLPAQGQTLTRHLHGRLLNNEITLMLAIADHWPGQGHLHPTSQLPRNLSAAFRMVYSCVQDTSHLSLRSPGI
mmetsp:Transcript_98219/g.219261  ORF Transcript_98219/g.219261 Transcript_98219/m.219261 type:complete len:206 (-) Transcript_98219:1799-2416(-)